MEPANWAHYMWRYGKEITATPSRLRHVHCPECQAQTRVLESRQGVGGKSVRRRRECASCGHRFTTHERQEGHGQLFVRKRDGRRQAFDRAKLHGGLARAAHKRPVPEEAIDAIVERIEAEAEAAGGELPARKVGERCLEGLRRLDRVAYLQFASVYKQLANVEELRSEMAQLEADSGGRSVRLAREDPLLPPEARQEERKR
jgi:transcriptional repressor NrdR